MKLLSEYIDEGLEIIAEEKGGKKEWYIQGPMICAEKVNANGRIYKADTIATEVDRYIREVVKQNKAVGELNHAASPNINYERASHIITELHRVGDTWVGRAKLLDTPMGRIAKSLVQEKIPLGISTRGMGSLAKDVSTGAMVVGPDFRLSCIDIVSQPSGPRCYAEGLFEDVEDAPDYYLNEDTGEWEPEEGEDTVADEIQEDDDVQIFMNYLTSLEEKAATLDENLHAIGEYLETVDGNVRAVAESQTNLLEGADILQDEYHEHLLEGMEALSGDQDELLENQYQLVENQNDLAEHHDNLVDLIIGLAKSLGKEEELRKIAARIQGNSDVVSRSVEGNAERNRAANRGNASPAPTGNNVHEAQLGALLAARPGAGLFSPGVRYTSRAAMLTEEQQSAINGANEKRAARMEAEKARVDRYAAYINRSTGGK